MAKKDEWINGHQEVPCMTCEEIIAYNFREAYARDSFTIECITCFRKRLRIEPIELDFNDLKEAVKFLLTVAGNDKHLSHPLVLEKYAELVDTFGVEF